MRLFWPDIRMGLCRSMPRIKNWKQVFFLNCQSINKAIGFSSNLYLVNWSLKEGNFSQGWDNTYVTRNWCKLIFKTSFFSGKCLDLFSYCSVHFDSLFEWYYIYVCQELKIENKFVRSQLSRNQQSNWHARPWPCKLTFKRG